MFGKVLLVSASAIACVVAAAPASAAVLTGPSAINPLTTTAGGVRFRALNTSGSQQEIYLGEHDLGVGGNRVQQDITWNQNGSNTFSLSYDSVTDKLTSKVNNNAVLTYNAFVAGLAPAVAAKSRNTLAISIRDAAVGAGSITLTGLNLNGTALTPPTAVGVEGVERFFGVRGNFNQSFTLTGSLDLAGGTFASNENNRVQLLVGNTVPEPATWAMMIGGFGLVGGAMRRRASKVVFA